MSSNGPPLFLTFRKAGKILGWNHATAKKWAAAHGLIVRVGDREFISVHKFKQEFPDIWADIHESYED